MRTRLPRSSLPVDRVGRTDEVRLCSRPRRARGLRPTGATSRWSRPGSAAPPPPAPRAGCWCCASPGPTGWPSIEAPTASSSTARGCRRSTSATVRRSRSVIRSAARGWFSRSVPPPARPDDLPVRRNGRPTRQPRLPAVPAAASTTARPQIPPQPPAPPRLRAAQSTEPPERSRLAGTDRAGHAAHADRTAPTARRPSGLSNPLAASRTGCATARSAIAARSAARRRRRAVRWSGADRADDHAKAADRSALLPHPRAELHLSVAAQTRARAPAGSPHTSWD